MQRIMIIGQPGSGKSTLARELGRRTGLPVVHIDHIHWMPGWVERPRTEKTRLCREVEDRPQWIFEGGHSATWDTRMARADLIIWIDLPVGLRLWRVARRTWAFRGQVRPDLPDGCPEGFHRETLPFWRYIWRTRRTARRNIVQRLAAQPSDKAVVHLQSPTAVRAWLAGLDG
jgi:adenylate kinase family enzyme